LAKKFPQFESFLEPELEESDGWDDEEKVVDPNDPKVVLAEYFGIGQNKDED
jgi:hypothetical protein